MPDPWNKQLPDVDTVREHYHDEGMSTAEIADEYGVTRPAVAAFMRRHDIPTQGRGQPSGEEHPGWIPIEKLLDDIIAGRVALGMWPQLADYVEMGSYSTRPIYNKFDSWPDAVDAAKERAVATAADWPVDFEEVDG